MRKSVFILIALALPVLLSQSGLALAQTGEIGSAATDVWGPTLRMLLSLIAVLAILGGCVLLAKRLRDGGAFKTGLIEVVSGISLGGRDKVVLLRVGNEQVLVGVSASGMRPLHVLRGQPKPEPREFDDYLEATQALEVPR
ncbi:MAG: flagellar biosynthetic protein FliO [Gammaproteobacteria bacterium]|nr:flagellar biosynthetic protein FliO [Gammaproteobacteria bacterium]